MIKPTPTENFYCGLLNSLDVNVDTDNSSQLLYAYEDDGSAGPMRVDKKILVIPTKANLKEDPEFWNSNIAFHPLIEQALRGESKVFRTLQSLINWKVIKTLSYTAYNLTLMAAHPEIPNNFNPRQHVLLDALPDANKKTVKFIKDITEASFSGGQTTRLIKTFIKRGGIYNSTKHSAALITTFSMFENGNIDHKKRTIFGVKAPRISDIESVVKLFKLILPRSDETNGEYYNFGSNDDTAPRLHVLLSGYVRIANHLNGALKNYGEFIEGYEEHLIDLSWVDALENFSKMQYDIPPLEDNYGEADKLTNGDGQTCKKLSTGDNIDELEHTACKKTSSSKSNQFNQQTTEKANPNESAEQHGQHSNIQSKANKQRSKKKMSIDPMMMMQMMNNGNNSSLDPMTLMAMGGDIDPMTMMMMNQGGDMDTNTLLMMNAMKGKNGDNKMNPLLMSQLMGGGGDIDPMMLMAMGGGDIDPMMLMLMNKDDDKKGGSKSKSKIDPMMLMLMNKDGDNKMNPLLMSQLMGGDSDIDPMMLMAMGGGDIDPMMLMMMNKDDDKKIDPMMLMMMNKDGDNKMNPLLMSQLMGGDSDIDPMMLMAMGGGDIDPMTMMLMSQNKKAKKGETVTPKQPAPSYPETTS